MTDLLGIKFPMIMAPMFLVSNEPMIEAAMASGIMGVFPSLNYREQGEIDAVLQRLNELAARSPQGSYGVNLIVQKTNPLYRKHLESCEAHKVPFYITSLGNPKEVIERAHSYGGKVFCDVTNLEHAQKVHDLGCDGFIAVGQGAGGHAGPYSLQVLVPSLRERFPDTLVAAAGGIASGEAIASMLAVGADGVSVGTHYIASTEAQVNDAYKQAIVDSGMQDIVMSTKISGTPCAIINTPYAKKIGYRQNWFERTLSNNPRTKKYFKMLVQFRGMKRLERAAFKASYKTLWSAGQSVEQVKKIMPVSEITEKLMKETEAAITRLHQLLVAEHAS
ncbi:MAG: nitronate monooxygenase [Bacteroidota bacterium]